MRTTGVPCFRSVLECQQSSHIGKALNAALDKGPLRRSFVCGQLKPILGAPEAVERTETRVRYAAGGWIGYRRIPLWPPSWLGPLPRY